MNDFADQYDDPRWQKKRLEILKRENYICQHCKKQKNELRAHHTYYNYNKKIWEYENESLLCLCQRCHSNLHNFLNQSKTHGLVTRNVENLTRNFKEIKNSDIINVLKKHGVPGNIALIYYKNYGLSYLIRKVWHFRYQLEYSKPYNPIGWFRTVIEHDKYLEPEDFHNWCKEKREKYKETDYPILYQPL